MTLTTKMLKGYLNEVDQRIADRKYAIKYDEAIALIAKAEREQTLQTKQDIFNAANALFREILTYKDSKQKMQYCQSQIATLEREIRSQAWKEEREKKNSERELARKETRKTDLTLFSFLAIEVIFLLIYFNFDISRFSFLLFPLMSAIFYLISRNLKKHGKITSDIGNLIFFLIKIVFWGLLIGFAGIILLSVLS